MREVHGFSTNGVLGNTSPLAVAEACQENGGLMSEQKTSPHQANATAPDESGPLLRLAGTLAGEPSEAERCVLELRSNAVLVLGSLRRDSRMLNDRLQRAGRIDPVKKITGASSLDTAANSTQELIQDLDELLVEFAETALNSSS